MMNKIRALLNRKVVKVPVVMQMEALECGAASLAMILAYYGKWVPLEKVRADCGVSRDGSSAKNIVLAARNYGLEAAGYRAEPETLIKEGSFPCIIHWEFNHFVVLTGFTGRHAVINDPARGHIKIPMDEFDRCFTGVVLMFSPTEAFEPGGRKKSTLSFAAGRLKASTAAMVFVMITTLLGHFSTVFHTGFSRFFMDYLLSGKNRELFTVFILLLCGLSLTELVVSAVQEIYSLKLNGKMAVVGNSTFMWKILRMPIEFFSQRMAGDIEMRRQANATIAQTLVDTFAPLVLNVIMMIIYLTVMIKNSPLLTLVGVGAIFLNAVLGRIISDKRVNITRLQMRDAGRLASTTVSGIQMVETIKASGAENGFFEKWAGLQASVNAQAIRTSRLEVSLGMLPQFISSVANYTVFVLGIGLSLRGQFTLGGIMAFQGILGAFVQPAMMLITAGQTIQEMRTQMERIDDVMEYPEDGIIKDHPLDDEVSYQKLSGALEMKHVSFGYSSLADPLIRDFSMKIEPGHSVAFVGASGCGKSTLAKLVSGLYDPWEGEILFDGCPLREIDRSVFTGSLAVVDQDIILFEDTISENIRMWDSSIEDYEVILAARDAQIHDDIMQRNGGYHGWLTEGGRDLSGGQKQRLEIARVLAQDPSIIILDEATSALDAVTEHELVKAVRDRGITCIVVAHRLSTIRDCDEIIVLKQGEVVERGTHDELYAKGGYYTELITNQ